MTICVVSGARQPEANEETHFFEKYIESHAAIMMFALVGSVNTYKCYGWFSTCTERTELALIKCYRTMAASMYNVSCK
jgi:hypothetical protein